MYYCSYSDDHLPGSSPPGPAHWDEPLELSVAERLASIERILARMQIEVEELRESLAK